MKKLSLLYLPLDERPCNAQFVSRIVRGTPVKVIAPPQSHLGCKKRGAEFEKIRQWLLNNAQAAQYAVISVDMLLYGGIVPSRLHHNTEEQLNKRLQTLRKLKEKKPSLKIYAFALIMRCPNYSSDDEEPDYYASCGREIFLTGQTEHKMRLGILDEKQGNALMEQLSPKTAGHLDDYLARRKINLSLLVKTAQLLGDVIDFLVLPLDDSSQYGYTAMDKESLAEALEAMGKRVPSYPGADEVGMTLTCRAVCDYYKVTPKINCVFPKIECREVVPLYEDRAVGLTLAEQLSAAGCAKSEKGDVNLFLNYPTCQPVEAWQQPSAGYAERDIPNFARQIAGSVSSGKVTALADCAYCNGGDAQLLKEVAKHTDLLRLAYAGWNTSSNTLGTVICQSVFALLFGLNEKFTAERYYEDAGYCGAVRQSVTESFPPHGRYNYFNAGAENGRVAHVVKEQLQKYVSANFPQVAAKYVIDRCRLPWKRMFEVDLTVKCVKR